MNRWAQQLQDHPVWTTAKNIEKHLSVESDQVSGESFSEKRRLEQFISRLRETLNKLDAEQTPFNRLDELNNHLSHVANYTNSYSTSEDVQYLRNANNQLQKSLSELCILKACTQPTSEQGQVNQINDLLDELASDIDNRQTKDKQRSTEIQQTLEQQKQQLNRLTSQMKEKDAELNSLISGWQNQFNEAQQAKLIEHNTAHKQRDKASSDLLEATEKKVGETVDNLILAKDAQLKSVLDNIENKSNEFIDAIKKKFEDTKDYCEEKREEILKLHQLVAGDSTTGGYAENAKAERKQANFWRWATIISIAITVIWLVIVIVSSNILGGGSLDWSGYPIIVSLTGVLLFGVGYGARQSARHRSNEKRNRELALKLAAFEPFISSLEAEQKSELRNKVSEQIFNSDESEEPSARFTWRIVDRFIDRCVKIQKLLKQ